MQIKDFKEIISTFSDPGEELIFDKNNILISVNGELIEVHLIQKSGEIHIKEGESEVPARQWIIHRLAHIELLASRLKETIHKTKYFISPSATLYSTLETDTADKQSTTDALTDTLTEVDQRRVLETKILYITSDAGEGKTSLINEMAHTQAENFLKKKSDWLLVPIPLGGRNFLRFDDITVGALQNRYRFPFLYYKSFIALVKMGVIVPAFDGFEEMFVENSSGEALSAMGTLVSSLESEGTIVVAARKAYYEFESIRSQEKLFDSIRTLNVSFGKLELNRWDKNQLIAYCIKRKVETPEEVYDSIIKRLDYNHAILTRAVLVKRLVDFFHKTASIEKFIRSIQSSGSDFFDAFVSQLIEREANEKWIDRSGELEMGTPILSINSHKELLTYVALAMWESRISYLKEDYLEFAADEFSETMEKSHHQSQQIRARIKGHAMLVPSSNAGHSIEFDHEEFQFFFLGEGIARLLKPLDNRAKAEVLTVFRRGILPTPARDALIKSIKRNNSTNSVDTVLNFFIDISSIESRTSYSHMNSSYVIINLLHELKGCEVKIQNISFEINSLLDKDIHKVVFTNCFFEDTGFGLANIRECQFIDCRFSQIRLSNKSSFLNVYFDKSEIDSLQMKGEWIESWSPTEIRQLLGKRGVKFDKPDTNEPSICQDDALVDLKKIIRAFMRSTNLSERLLLKKLGKVRGAEFINQSIPQLKKSGIVKEVDSNHSSKVFRLDVSVENLNSAICLSEGKFNKVLEKFR